MERLTKREGKHTVRIGNEWRRHDSVWDRLAEYEDIGATPDELKTAISLYIELSEKMRRIVKDMRYYLDENDEDGIVYIPKFVIEEIAYGR